MIHIKDDDDLNEFIWRPILACKLRYKEKAYYKKYGFTIQDAMLEYGRWVLLTEIKDDN